MGEELLNRGVLVFGISALVQRKVKTKKKANLLTMFVSSVIFSALHFGRYPILEEGLMPYILLFLSGIVLFTIAYYCGLLFASISHFTWNFLIFFNYSFGFTLVFFFAIALVIPIAFYKYGRRRKRKNKARKEEIVKIETVEVN
jgi:hypothetical protein